MFDYGAMAMSDQSAKDRLRSVNEQRDLLVQSIRIHLLPILAEKQFAAAPLVHRGPVDREAVETLPLGRLRRIREGGVDLIQIQVAKNRGAFRILAGVVPKDGLMTFTGHWAPEDVIVDWLNEYFVMYACPRFRTWFSVWHLPHRSPVRSDYEKLASQVAKFLPELESALTEHRVGPHIRRVVIPRPAPKMPG